MLPRLGPSARRAARPRAALASPFLLAPLPIRYTSTLTAKKKAKGPKQVIEFGELPINLLDPEGNTVKPLPKHREVTKTEAKRKATGKKGDSEVLSQDDLEYNAAVRANKVPDTMLSRLVWDNWRRFPDCVILTQVGNFYESYFEPAIQVSSVLGIKLTRKTYKNGQFPFTGFPIHQIEKYLKILVNDYGYTVAIIDEEKDPLNPPEEDAVIVRSVARVVTPGTLLDERWITGSESRYLLAVAFGPEPKAVEGEEEEATPQPLQLAYADVSTGEFFTKECTTADIEDELARIAPREIVLDSRLRDEWLDGESAADAQGPRGNLFHLLRVLGVHVSFTDATQRPDLTESPMVKKPKKRSAPLPPPGLVTMEREAISLLRHHLEYALRGAMPTIPDQFNVESNSNQMHIDAATLQALEIRTAFRPGGLIASAPSTTASGTISGLSVKGTLISTLSRTVTDSGHRLLRRTFSAPSTSLPEINSRLALVAAFADRQNMRSDVRDQLREIVDVMRIIQRFRASRGDGTDVWDVGLWIRSVEKLLHVIRIHVQMEPQSPANSPNGQPEGVDRLNELLETFKPLSDLADVIETSIDEVGVQRGGIATPEEDGGAEAAGDAMTQTSKVSMTRAEKKKLKEEEEARRKDILERQRWWIKPSFSTELTNLHKRIKTLTKRREVLQKKLQDEFEADTLSLVANDKGGYFVNVKKKTELGRVERSGLFGSVSETRGSKTFVYSEWSSLGLEMGKALEKLELAQSRALNRLRAMVVEHADMIQRNAELIDEIDLSSSFAQAAVDLRLTRPVLDEGTGLDIVDGRHPSVETGLLATARVFTPNSTHMTDTSRLHVITGPNQGGKSTLLRQTAVIAILAQSGSFVPAESVSLGVVDRVFSRVGARDDLFRDRSTFMLEMVETAAILKQATPRSLVIMDEIGRGTTLHAGVSIAYATLDYILQHVGCRTLFATHYHELTHMLGAPVNNCGGVATIPEGAYVRPGVSFFCTDVHEADGAFSYSYRLRPGINYNSHAIKAAQLAGMPASFLETAEATLRAFNETAQDKA